MFCCVKKQVEGLITLVVLLHFFRVGNAFVTFLQLWTSIAIDEEEEEGYYVRLSIIHYIEDAHLHLCRVGVQSSLIIILVYSSTLEYKVSILQSFTSIRLYFIYQKFTLDGRKTPDRLSLDTHYCACVLSGAEQHQFQIKLLSGERKLIIGSWSKYRAKVNTLFELCIYVNSMFDKEVITPTLVVALLLSLIQEEKCYIK